VTPTSKHPGTVITVNGERVRSGDTSAAIDLIGPNAVAMIVIVVTAENGTLGTTYTVVVRPAGIRIRARVFLEGALQ